VIDPLPGAFVTIATLCLHKIVMIEGAVRPFDTGMSNGTPSEAFSFFPRRLLLGRPLLRRLIGNSVWQVADKIFRMGAGVLVNVCVARYLGPARFGLINFAVALVALFSAIAAFGLPGVVVRDLIARPEQRTRILGSALVLRLLGAMTAILLVLGATLALRAGDPSALAIVMIVSLSAVPQAWDVIDYDYQARIHARPVVIARNSSFALFAATRILLAILKARLVWFAWAIWAEAAVTAALLLRRARVDRIRVSLRAASWEEVRSLARTSWPLVIAGLSVSAYMRLDQVMLGKMLGDTGVGVFSAAVRISEALYFLPVAVATTVSPALMQAARVSAREYERRYLEVASLLVWIALLTAGLFATFSGQIIQALYGPAYAPAATVLAIHAWAGVLASLGVCGQIWLTNAGYLKYSMYQTLAGAAVNVVLNLVLIPRLGVVGAALATCAAQVTCVLLMVVAFRATRPLLRLQLAAFAPWFIRTLRDREIRVVE
jgi:polysaccharide transporter, PST family